MIKKYFMSFSSNKSDSIESDSTETESNRLLINDENNIHMYNILDSHINDTNYILEDEDENDEEENDNIYNKIKTIYKLKYSKYYTKYIKLLDNINTLDIPYNTELEKKVIQDIFIKNKDIFYCYETITPNIDNFDSYDFCLPSFNYGYENKIKSLTIERININDIKSHIEISINTYIHKELLNNVLIPFLPKHKYYIYEKEFNNMKFNIKSKLVTLNNIQGYIIYLEIDIN